MERTPWVGQVPDLLLRLPLRIFTDEDDRLVRLVRAPRGVQKALAQGKCLVSHRPLYLVLCLGSHTWMMRTDYPCLC